MSRGTIHTRSRFKQQCAFDGMVWGTISPTDVDCAIDFNDRLFVFIEAKSGDVPLRQGQRILLERLCRRCKGQAVALVARHSTPPDEDIPLAECEVESLYSGGCWRDASVRMTVLDVIGVLLNEHGLDFSVAKQTHVTQSCKHLERWKSNGRCSICEHR